MFSLSELARQGQDMLQRGRVQEALALFTQGVQRFPLDPVAHHYMAAVLGDCGRWAEAEPFARRALEMGLGAPQTWLVLARACQNQGRFEDAERAFREAIGKDPFYFDAQQELAQLRWMLSGDTAVALADVDAALRVQPLNVPLLMIKSRVLRGAGRDDLVFALMSDAMARAPNDASFVTTAAQSALAIGDAEKAVELARRADQLSPHEPVVYSILIESLLAAGRVEEADVSARIFVANAPENQHALALQTTVWRLKGDPRYRALYDYDSFVGVSELATPRGWASLGAYLKDLAATLRGAHRYNTHPFGQSILHGTQAVDILQLEDPAAKALPEALDPSIRNYLARLGRGSDPFRARNTGAYAFLGMWSIRMKAGGFHINHVHPQGWVSSACYVAVPKNTENRAGWIKFGEPGSPTKPPLSFEHAVQPAPGKLVLFPSYMWHGTVPFTGDDERLTFAFDLLPAPASV